MNFSIAGSQIYVWADSAFIGRIGCLDSVPTILSSEPPPLPAGERYVTRNHAFASTTTWSLCAGALIIEEVNRPVRRIELSKIVSLRLEFAPTRPEPNRFRCRLTQRGGKVLEFFNRTYRGVYDFADTSAAYVAFVQALHGQLVRYSPDCQFLAGSTRFSYALNLGILLLVALVVVGAVIFFISAGVVWVALIKVILIGFYTPMAIRWVTRSRPRHHTATTIPPDVLPKVSA